MAVRTYANEMLLRLDRFLDEKLSVFLKLHMYLFLMCFKEIVLG